MFQLEKFQIVSSVTSYLVILIQYELAMEENKRINK